MAHFRDEEARSIIRETYAGVRSDQVAVAAALYGADQLERIPEAAAELALGVGNPVLYAALQPGETVLDLGCGAGIDTLLAAAALGPAGRAIGIDMTPEMIERTRANASAAGLGNVEVLQGLTRCSPRSSCASWPT